MSNVLRLQAASPVSPDAVMALRLAEKLVEIMQVLDGELQQALSDVPGSVREALRNVPAFEERLMRHSKGNGQVRLISFVIISRFSR